MKKIMALALLSLRLFVACTPAFAQNVPTVCADAVQVNTENTVLIPVRMKNNPGIMGMRITVQYDPENLQAVSLTRGELLSGGNYNSSFKIVDGQFDVLWNDADDLQGDGVLFVLGIRAARAFDKDAIELSYTPEDTFNAQFADVAIQCEPITVTYSEEVLTSSSETTGAPPNESHAVSAEQFIDAVQLALEETGHKTVQEITGSDTGFVNAVNKKLRILAGADAGVYSGTSDIVRAFQSIYSQQFVDTVTQEMEPEAVRAAIAEALEAVHAQDVAQVAEADREKFVRRAEKALQEARSDLPDFSEDLDTQSAFDALRKINGAVQPIEPVSAAETDAAQRSGTRTGLWIGIGVVCAVLILVSIWVFHKKRRKEEVES